MRGIARPQARVITKEELNRAGCDILNCTHDHSVLFLHGACHSDAPTRARYVKEIETLVFIAISAEMKLYGLNYEMSKLPWRWP